MSKVWTTGSRSKVLDTLGNAKSGEANEAKCYSTPCEEVRLFSFMRIYMSVMVGANGIVS